MAPIAVSDMDSSPVIPKMASQPPASIARYDANSADTSTDLLVSVIERDGGVIVENLISKDLAEQIRTELKPYFDTDKVDRSGFFPTTTQRATGLLGRSAGCVELAMNKTYIDVANRIVSSTYSYWDGQTEETVTSKPIISSTVGFRVNPGGKQQCLHRDDSDYHTRNIDMPAMIGHLWGPERCPLDEEAVPIELEPGSALIFLGNMYHAGGGNTTKDQARETVGIFLCKSYLRPAENQFLMVSPEIAKHLPPQAQRLLGYGISLPSVGFVDYQDPMRKLFGVEDEETVDM
ncbi:hypothetical protein PRZ48_000894 [Zasmidium cellare]|uniref:Phytanoyl-CoA dioxygenase n=1 Tax=Zasmidium cellare TaxID=395010 RepID=A0ABR0F153_ZASCE|nr:hypothetical protein PRZ48_000894 [Zasmidium cellare]